MFKRHASIEAPTVTVTVEGRAVTVSQTDNVVAALFAAGFDHAGFSAASGRKRAPYCLMGACFECLVEIDGVPNQQACLTRVREGMRIKRQPGVREFER